MNIEIITVPCLEDNYAYLIHNHRQNKTFLIVAPEASPIIKILDQKKWNLEKIVITHHHSDHILGIDELIRIYNPIISGAKADVHRLPTLSEKLSENDILNLGDLKFTVMEVPGHTIGHIAVYCKEIEAVFTGDSLMVLGCGRLFEGSAKMMWKTLNKFMKLPNETKVYSGHEYALKNSEFAISIDSENKSLKKRYDLIQKLTKRNLPSVPCTIKNELETNPFLRADNNEIRKALRMFKDTDENVFAELRRRRDIF